MFGVSQSETAVILFSVQRKVQLKTKQNKKKQREMCDVLSSDEINESVMREEHENIQKMH